MGPRASGCQPWRPSPRVKCEFASRGRIQFRARARSGAGRSSSTRRTGAGASRHGPRRGFQAAAMWLLQKPEPISSVSPRPRPRQQSATLHIYPSTPARSRRRRRAFPARSSLRPDYDCASCIARPHAESWPRTRRGAPRTQRCSWCREIRPTHRSADLAIRARTRTNPSNSGRERRNRRCRPRCTADRWPPPPAPQPGCSPLKTLYSPSAARRLPSMAQSPPAPRSHPWTGHRRAPRRPWQAQG